MDRVYIVFHEYEVVDETWTPREKRDIVGVFASAQDAEDLCSQFSNWHMYDPYSRLSEGYLVCQEYEVFPDQHSARPVFEREVDRNGMEFRLSVLEDWARFQSRPKKDGKIKDGFGIAEFGEWFPPGTPVEEVEGFFDRYYPGGLNALGKGD